MISCELVSTLLCGMYFFKCNSLICSQGPTSHTFKFLRLSFPCIEKTWENWLTDYNIQIFIQCKVALTLTLILVCTLAHTLACQCGKYLWYSCLGALRCVAAEKVFASSWWSCRTVKKKCHDFILGYVHVYSSRTMRNYFVAKHARAHPLLIAKWHAF